jgi:hypothetical protein
VPCFEPTVVLVTAFGGYLAHAEARAQQFKNRFDVLHVIGQFLRMLAVLEYLAAQVNVQLNQRGESRMIGFHAVLASAVTRKRLVAFAPEYRVKGPFAGPRVRVSGFRAPHKHLAETRHRSVLQAARSLTAAARCEPRWMSKHSHQPSVLAAPAGRWPTPPQRGNVSSQPHQSTPQSLSSRNWRKCRIPHRAG